MMFDIYIYKYENCGKTLAKTEILVTSPKQPLTIINVMRWDC